MGCYRVGVNLIIIILLIEFHGIVQPQGNKYQRRRACFYSAGSAGTIASKGATSSSNARPVVLDENSRPAASTRQPTSSQHGTVAPSHAAATKENVKSAGQWVEVSLCLFYTSGFYCREGSRLKSSIYLQNMFGHAPVFSRCHCVLCAFAE